MLVSIAIFKLVLRVLVPAIIIVIFALRTAAATSGGDIPWCHVSAVPIQNEYALLVQEPAIPEEHLLVQSVDAVCKHSGAHVDPFDVLALLRLEEVLGVSKWRRGLLPGVFCIEAGLRKVNRKGGPILGDFRDGVPMAWGPFQLWPTTRAACRGSDEAAFDLVWAARCWIARVESSLPKASRLCDTDPWMVAEAAVSNVRKYGWRCKEHSAHWRVATEVWAEYERLTANTGSL